MMKNRKPLLIAIVLVVVAALMAGAYLLTQPKGAVGAKTVAVEIVNGESAKTVSIQTDAAFLRAALEQQGLIAGEESEYGLFVQTVDGYTAQEANQEWWCFTKGGGMLTTGVDTTPIADGDHFEATLMVGY